ncbi:MAG: hypothetical protein QG635_1902 [Bacteroidota bacterium]|nr:hypothetical protein [Bacteroidota bacterium]
MHDSNLYREYEATFEIIENQIFIKDIKIQIRIYSIDETIHNAEWKSVLEEVFPTKEDKIIVWFTGLLVLPYGRSVEPVYSFPSGYENYILLEINSGKLIKEKSFNNMEYEEFKDKQYQAFKKTEEYKELRAKLQNKYNSEEITESIIKDFIIEYTSKILTE